MEKHYAIVKCDRYQETWSFAKRDWDSSYHGDSFWPTMYLREVHQLKNKEYFPYIKSRRQTKENLISTIKSTERHWREDVCKKSYLFHKEFSFGKSNIKNGTCVLWEGEVNLSRLREGDNLFIPTIEKYLLINKVELNPDGKIFYYVDYKKIFHDTVEQDRIKAVDRFIDEMYGDVESFEEMKQYRHDRNSYVARFEEITGETNLLIKNLLQEDHAMITKPKESTVDNSAQSNNELTLEEKPDKQWEKTSMFILIGGIVVLTLLFLIGLG